MWSSVAQVATTVLLRRSMHVLPPPGVTVWHEIVGSGEPGCMLVSSMTFTGAGNAPYLSRVARFCALVIVMSPLLISTRPVI